MRLRTQAWQCTLRPSFSSPCPPQARPWRRAWWPFSELTANATTVRTRWPVLPALHRCGSGAVSVTGFTSVTLAQNSCGKPFMSGLLTLLGTRSGLGPITINSEPTAAVTLAYVPHHAAVRALAFKWIRILFRCWKDRKPYDEQTYIASLRRRGSPLAAALPKA